MLLYETPIKHYCFTKLDFVKNHFSGLLWVLYVDWEDIYVLSHQDQEGSMVNTKNVAKLKIVCIYVNSNEKERDVNEGV